MGGECMERISIFQLFTMTIFFQVGTNIIFGFASLAGRDAWLAILICTVLSIFIVLLHLDLMERNPGLTIVEWFPAQFGRWLGMPIAWLYPLQFLYSGARTMSDLNSLIPSTLLPDTPSWFVVAAMLLVIVHCLFSGIEVLARFTEYTLPVIFLFLTLEIILLFGSGVVNLQDALPILGEGWGRVWTSVWPVGISQLFSETLILAMIWPLVTKQKKIRKITILATTISGLTVSCFSLIQIAVLGEDLVERTSYPLYLLVRQISVAEFLENLDAIIALNMVITAYVKITIYFFVAVRSIQLLMNIRSSRSLIFPVAFILYLLSMTMSTNINEHLYVFDKLTRDTLLSPLLYIFLPSLLLIVTLIRKKWSQKRNSQLG